MKNKKMNFYMYPLFFVGLLALVVTTSCKKKTTDDPNSVATVTTAAITDLTDNSAVSGGEVTADGGAEVTERGICFGQASNPTVDDATVIKDAVGGTGSFTANLTGLAYNTTYYVRAYAINSQGTAYGNEVEFTTLYKVGGNGPAGGLVFYDKGDDSDGWRYLEVAPNDLENSHAWGCGGKGTEIDGADNLKVGYGMENTADIVAGCEEADIAAYVCSNYEVNGFDDWFLPSRDALIKIYENLYLEDMGNFDMTATYLSSSEINKDQAYAYNFGENLLGQTDKAIPRKVRAVRRF